jgi:glycosyltransferase involved in cell wall biosynthesis
MDIKVSVVVPVFNCEKYLSTCLDSLINQTLNDIEIICIDDAGSKDNSSKILENYAQKDSRIKILKTLNQYVGLARNQGVKLAKGEYLIFQNY